ncbi:low molecular weight protein-tyrosine-phosphatase [uncultured Albimonas sp.]|uniref:low molecular weight protein-tyrosine-phosphatase n=1 Tax=uncultured Albimonas sp. TaxID=1331701 RepID=UPI0030EE7A05|tara:strand:+ start:1230 stop:1697 length:468 start_codon:yes stop_codon:yes gene_type:complete
MTRLLFVCLGNICRSPAAEGVARAMAEARGLKVEIDSAGTGGWHAGEPPDPRMREAAARRGYDLASLRARQLRRADFADFDHLLAMDKDNLATLERARPADARATLSLMLSHAPALPEREVPDPYYGGPGGFEHVLDLLEPSVAGLLDRVEAEGR